MVAAPAERKATAQDISDRLGGKKQGKGFQARCPCHDDKHASLSIADGDNGKLLLYCHAGCKYQDIADKLGVPQGQATNGKRQIAVYQYRDRSGKVAHETVRYVLPNGDKSFSQRHQNGNGMVWNLTGATLYPYRLSEILAARDAGHNVYICEGEKDADSLVRLGLVATTNPMGANKPKVWAEIATHFAGVDAVIVPDNDEAGQDNIAVIATAIKPFTKSVSVAKVTAPYKDITECVEARGDSAVGELLDSIVEWKPTLDVRQATVAAPILSLTERRAKGYAPLTIDELAARPPDTYLAPEIPAAALGMLVGQSGTGKSLVARDFALAVKETVYVAGEGAGGIADRFIAARNHYKTDDSNVRIIDRAVPLLNGDEVQAFVQAVQPLAPKLIIFDTLARCMLGGDENSARDAGLLVEACDVIKRATGATVLLIHHTNKGGASERGSSAFKAACDFVIELTNDDGLITLSCGKSKDSKPFESRKLRMVEAPAREGRTSIVLLSAKDVMHSATDPLSQQQRQVLDALALETFVNTGARYTSLRDVVNISNSTLYRVLSNLIRRDYVRQDAKGDPYRVTGAGLSAIGRGVDL